MTPEQLESTVRELAMEQPDKAFPTVNGADPEMGVTTAEDGCKYYFEKTVEPGEPQVTDKPCCIFGHAFDKIGEGREWITNSSVPVLTNGKAIYILLDAKVDGLRDNWFTDVQVAQDTGFTWSQSVDLADNKRESK